jgi:hypothetical protein
MGAVRCRAPWRGVAIGSLSSDYGRIVCNSSCLTIKLEPFTDSTGYATAWPPGAWQLLPPVIPSGCHGAGMACQFLHCTDISTSIQKVTDEGAPEIMGGERRHLGLLPSLPENIQHRLITHPSGADSPSLNVG